MDGDQCEGVVGLTAAPAHNRRLPDSVAVGEHLRCEQQECNCRGHRCAVARGGGRGSAVAPLTGYTGIAVGLLVRVG